MTPWLSTAQKDDYTTLSILLHSNDHRTRRRLVVGHGHVYSTGYCLMMELINLMFTTKSNDLLAAAGKSTPAGVSRL